MTKRERKVLKHYVSVWDVSHGLLAPRMHGQSISQFRNSNAFDESGPGMNAPLGL